MNSIHSKNIIRRETQMLKSSVWSGPVQMLDPCLPGDVSNHVSLMKFIWKGKGETWGKRNPHFKHFTIIAQRNSSPHVLLMSNILCSGGIHCYTKVTKHKKMIGDDQTPILLLGAPLCHSQVPLTRPFYLSWLFLAILIQNLCAEKLLSLCLGVFQSFDCVLLFMLYLQLSKNPPAQRILAHFFCFTT